jgi:hypothetical protein
MYMFQTCLHLQVNPRRVTRIHRHVNLHQHCLLVITWFGWHCALSEVCLIDAMFQELNLLPSSEWHVIWLTLHCMASAASKFSVLTFHLHGSFKTTYEDGTDGAFQNIGTENSDTGESPKKKKCHSQHSENLKWRKICELIYPVWNKEELPEEWKGVDRYTCL